MVNITHWNNLQTDKMIDHPKTLITYLETEPQFRLSPHNFFLCAWCNAGSNAVGLTTRQLGEQTIVEQATHLSETFLFKPASDAMWNTTPDMYLFFLYRQLKIRKRQFTCHWWPTHLKKDNPNGQYYYPETIPLMEFEYLSHGVPVYGRWRDGKNGEGGAPFAKQTVICANVVKKAIWCIIQKPTFIFQKIYFWIF